MSHEIQVLYRTENVNILVQNNMFPITGEYEILFQVNYADQLRK